MNEPSAPELRYLLFDIEAAADGGLISRVRYPGEGLSPAEATRRYRQELIEQTGRDVFPVTYVFPVSVVVGKVDADFLLFELKALDAPRYRSEEMTRLFWKGWEHYNHPTLVSFNGRGYDLPVLELAAFRYGIALPNWFNVTARSFEQSRHRYNLDAHLDLCDILSNFGAVRLSGGLNLLAQVLGKPGKTGVDGSQVQDLYEQGRLEAINDYCCCDVLDTYFVFLRTQVLMGHLTLAREQELVQLTRRWLERQAAEVPAFRTYLDHWGDWAGVKDSHERRNGENRHAISMLTTVQTHLPFMDAVDSSGTVVDPASE
ncbi:MAG: hypothetical protein KatS3mg113_0145 [Planctomycetaceae bacterium]|nr:MAG: hypothetical protein KatS3mg113_0145 [Planctomycetaceae bacterium]